MKHTWFFLFILAGLSSFIFADNSDVLNLLGSGTTDSLEITNSLIRFDTRAIDKKGNPVRGLKAEDFKIYQDGRRQTITEFREISPENRGTEPRIIVFIIDDFGLTPKEYSQIRTAIKHFAKNVMQPSDIVGLARTAGAGMVFQPLTSDAAELAAAVDHWQWNVESERPEVTLQILNPVPRTIFIGPCSGPGCVQISQTLPIFGASPLPIFNVFQDLSYVDAVVNIVGDLRAIPHRKAVILFSDNNPDMKRMGVNLADQMIQASANLYQCGLPGWKRKWSKVAKNTGGYAVKARDDSFREIEQILEDFDHGYLLGYEPDAKTLDMVNKNSSATESATTVTVSSSVQPKKHSLKIKTDIRGVKIRTRSGFSESLLGPKIDPIPLGTSQKLYRDILGSSPFISGNLKVTAEALSFFSPPGGNIVHVTLHVDGKDLVFGPGAEDGYRNAEVEVTGILALNKNTIRRYTGKAGFVAPIPEFDEYRKRSFSTSFEIQAPIPGLYSLRAGVRQRREGQFGNALLLVEIPDIRRSGLLASGIVTYKKSERPDSGTGTYAITREFRRTEPFGCYLQVYNARRDKSSGMTRLESQFRLYRDNTLVKASEVLPVLDGGEDTVFNIIAVNFDINSGDELPAGNYLLEILVVDRLADKKDNTVTRSVAFELVE
jgi:VWFA-related protein